MPPPTAQENGPGMLTSNPHCPPFLEGGSTLSLEILLIGLQYGEHVARFGQESFPITWTHDGQKSEKFKL